MADAADLKSATLNGYVGSNPTLGTNDSASPAFTAAQSPH